MAATCGAFFLLVSWFLVMSPRVLSASRHIPRQHYRLLRLFVPIRSIPIHNTECDFSHVQFFSFQQIPSNGAFWVIRHTSATDQG